ncbi:hypothetical protein [Streptomyces sp. x-80]|uniref:hypothetical protein n=1 Tax=Streptomyces sp. x-80 TaxID=2789282 RepID=UPI003980BA19
MTKALRHHSQGRILGQPREQDVALEAIEADGDAGEQLVENPQQDVAAPGLVTPLVQAAPAQPAHRDEPWVLGARIRLMRSPALTGSPHRPHMVSTPADVTVRRTGS